MKKEKILVIFITIMFIICHVTKVFALVAPKYYEKMKIAEIVKDVSIVIGILLLIILDIVIFLFLKDKIRKKRFKICVITICILIVILLITFFISKTIYDKYDKYYQEYLRIKNGYYYDYLDIEFFKSIGEK